MQPLIVSREQWLVARKAHLKNENASPPNGAAPPCGHDDTGGRAGVLGFG